MNLDTAVEASEILGAQLEALDKGFLRKLVDAFAVTAAEYSGDAQEVVRNIAYGFHLEEALAADDPVSRRNWRHGAMRGIEREGAGARTI